MLDPLEQELRNDWEDDSYRISVQNDERRSEVFANKEYFREFAVKWLNSRGLTREENVKRMIDAVAKTL